MCDAHRALRNGLKKIALVITAQFISLHKKRKIVFKKKKLKTVKKKELNEKKR